jgi:hypothetical protein
MKIAGFSIKKISAERINPIKGNLEVKQGLNIDDIQKEQINISEKPAIRFDFTFSIDYSPNFAKIEVKGAIIAIDDKDEAKDIFKDWKKKKFDHQVKLPLFNFIMDKCNIKALELEEEIGLPFHIPFPKLAPGNPSQTAAKNNNPANYAG